MTATEHLTSRPLVRSLRRLEEHLLRTAARNAAVAAASASTRALEDARTLRDLRALEARGVIAPRAAVEDALSADG